MLLKNADIMNILVLLIETKMMLNVSIINLGEK